MAVITRAYSETDGNIAYASSVNKVIDDLYTLQNGNINSANVGASAIGTGNIKDSAITTAKVASTFTIKGEQVAGSAVWQLQQLILGGF